MRIVQLLSGGFDSVGQALLLQAAGFTIYPMHVQFRIGGGHVVKEKKAAQAVTDMCGFEPVHHVYHRIPLREYATRNRTMMRLAGEYADTLEIRDVAIGVSCMPEDIYTAEGGDNAEDNSLGPLQLQVPAHIHVHVLQMERASLLQLVGALPIVALRAMFKTTSCQYWGKVDCGQCHSCIKRHAAFIAVIGYDYTEYVNDPKLTARWTTNFERQLRAIGGNKSEDEG